MADDIAQISGIFDWYNSFLNTMPEGYRVIPNVTIIAVMIAFLSIMIYYFCQFIAKRDIIGLNLKKYNKADDPTVAKMYALIFYILEFLVIVPIAVFIWFTVFSVSFIPLATEFDIPTIILLSASLVVSIRIIAYINEEISEEVAEMFPFTLLFVLITTPGFNLQTIFGRMTEITLFFDYMWYYLLVIFALEFILRMVTLPKLINDAN